MVNFELLNLSDLDPDKDIVVINVYSRTGSAQETESKVKWAREYLGKLLAERGFSSVIIPVTKDMIESGFKPFHVVDVDELDNSSEAIDIVREAINAVHSE